LSGLEKMPLNYVLETLSLGPRNSTKEGFNQNDVLAELDSLMEFCRNQNIDEENHQHQHKIFDVYKKLQKTKST